MIRIIALLEDFGPLLEKAVPAGTKRERSIRGKKVVFVKGQNGKWTRHKGGEGDQVSHPQRQAPAAAPKPAPSKAPHPASAKAFLAKIDADKDHDQKASKKRAREADRAARKNPNSDRAAKHSAMKNARMMYRQKAAAHAQAQGKKIRIEQ